MPYIITIGLLLFLLADTQTVDVDTSSSQKFLEEYKNKNQKKDCQCDDTVQGDE